MSKVSTTELERQIFILEGIRIVIRCNTDNIFNSYEYERQTSDKTTLNNWLTNRIYPIVGEYEVEVVNGSGIYPHSRTNLIDIRKSYTGQ